MRFKFNPYVPEGALIRDLVDLEFARKGFPPTVDTDLVEDVHKRLQSLLKDEMQCPQNTDKR